MNRVEHLTSQPEADGGTTIVIVPEFIENKVFDIQWQCFDKGELSPGKTTAEDILNCE